MRVSKHEAKRIAVYRKVARRHKHLLAFGGSI